MSDRKDPRRRSGRSRSGGSRRAGPSSSSSRTRSAASSGGFFGRLFGPPVSPAMSEMPRFRTSLAQGFLLTASNPILSFGPMILVFVMWLILLAFGFVGSSISLSQALAMPPLATAFDTQNAVSIAGQQTGLLVALPLLLVRALLVGIVSGLLLEGFERGGATGVAGIVRGLLALPLVLASIMLSFVGLFVAVQLGALLGPGLGALFQVLLPALVLYALAFVPFAAVRERRPLAETLRRSLAAARTPGGRHLSFCFLYVLLSFMLPWLVPGRSLIEANPDVGTWVGLFLITFVHVGFTAAMAHRWLAVESSLPEAAPRR